MRKEFQEVELMTKEEAISEVKAFFKGNKKFIEQAILLIYSTHYFEKLGNLEITKDDWNWEKYLSITIYSEAGFKHFCYRKGNKKYASTINSVLEGNKTADIDGFKLSVYHSKNKELEEFDF